MKGDPMRRKRAAAGQTAIRSGRRDPVRIIRDAVSLVCVLTVLVLFLYSKFTSRDIPAYSAENTLTVFFIDVGQGDCELILCGGHCVLVDAGEAEYGAKVVSVLRNLGVESLDCVVATHPHADHIGGLIEVLEYFKVGELLTPRLTENNIPTTRVYERFLEAARQSGARTVPAVPGDEREYGEIRFTVLAPLADEAADLNDMSAVLRLRYGGVSFLFTADAGKEAEDAMLDAGCELSADVLKVPHHGSKAANSERFLTAVSPRVAVVECGDGTEYHPHRDTMSRLTALGAEVYRTDMDGTVAVTTDGVNISVNKEK